MTLEELAALLEESGSASCFTECRNAILQKDIVSFSEAGGPVANAFKMLTIRQWTTQRGGASTCGFEETLRGLAELPQDEMLSSWTLQTSNRFFVLFSLKTTGKLVGCIRIMKRSEAEQDARRTLFGKLTGLE